MKYSTYFFAILILSVCATLFAQGNTDKFGAYKNLYGGGGAGVMDFGAPPQEADAPKLEIQSEFIPPAGSEPGVLTITAKIPENWTIYSISQKPGGPTRSVIHTPEIVKKTGSVTVTPAPHVKMDEPIWGKLAIEYHDGTVSWQVPFFWASPGVTSDTLEGSVEAQLCDPNTCMAPEKFAFSAKAVEVPVVEVPVEETPTAEETPAVVETPVAEAPAAPSKVVEIPEDTAEPETPARSLWVWLLFAYLGGLILNLMPCVLPVIAPKLYSFIHQSGESRLRIFGLNVSYAFGLLLVFWVLAALSRIGDVLAWLATVLPASMAEKLPQIQNLAWGAQFQYVPFVVFMISLVFVMGLSFLGVWEIPIPGFVAGGSLGKMQKREGFLGAFCMGILTTVLATPCVGPFLGPVFGFTMTQAVGMSFLMFTVIGLGLASPYLIVGACPALIRFLPKPGEWMETLKEVMGFFFLGACVWLFYVLMKVDSEWVVPVLGFLVGLWLACWLVGKVTLSGAEATGRILAWSSAVVIVVFSGFLMFHLWFLDNTNVKWEPFSAELVEQYREEGRVVFIDFTASWCSTCQTNTLTAIETEKVGECLGRNDIRPILADFSAKSPEIQTYMWETNHSTSIPLIIIWTPKQPEPIVLSGIITESQLLEALEEAAN